MDDDADAKMIQTPPTPENLKRPSGHPRITWLNTIQRDLRAYNLTLNEAGSEPPSVEADVYVSRNRYALPEKKKKIELPSTESQTQMFSAAS